MFKEPPKNPIAVVIPCYKVKKHILGVISGIGEYCTKIYVVDDACPEDTGAWVTQNCQDPRVVVLRNSENLGVGGAVMHGYQAALSDGMEIFVKVDGDGQMDPALIPYFVAPIISGDADYTKGNRFYDLERIGQMPKLRLFGNAVLSFMTKLSSGYWDLFDPTNGYTAIHHETAKHLPFAKISNRYFFETDMLFRLNTLRAVVVDIPMDAKYDDEVSNLKINKVVTEFIGKHLRNFSKRIFYNYYLRDMSLASFELPLGCLMVVFGIVFGGFHWWNSLQEGGNTPVGTVMLASLPLLLGTQFILAFFGHDIASVPRRPLQVKRRQFARLAGKLGDQ